jgi:glutamate-1-semialdehyde 2,1-aminomutase
MDLISEGKVVHAGTYNSNPVVIAAGLATVRYLKENRNTVYPKLYRLGELLRVGLRQSFGKAGVPALLGGQGPVVQASLTDAPTLRNYRDWIKRDTATYQKLVTRLVDAGVRTIARGTWYLSSAHTEEDVALTLREVESILNRGL